MQIEDLIRQQGGADCSVPEYLRTMACVHLETGRRVMPRYIDDEVFRAAADQIEQLEAALWKQGAEILSLRQELAEAREAVAAVITKPRNFTWFTRDEGGKPVVISGDTEFLTVKESKRVIEEIYAELNDAIR